MKIHALWPALALIAVCNTALAQWQWIDTDGRRVFSDRAPPPHIPEKNILKRASAAPQPAATAGNEAAAADSPALAASAAANARATPVPAGVDKELEARKKQAAEAEAAKRRAEEERITKARIESCARAKQAKATLDSGVRIARTGPTGEREILDDAARAAELKHLQGVIAADCR